MTDKYDLARIRKTLDHTLKQKHKDPTIFSPPLAKGTEEMVYRFYILPPLVKGDKCATGVASATMDSFLVQAGSHYFNKKPYACPRISPFTDEECPICDTGFKLMQETEVKEERRRIARIWMPGIKYYINIYFPQKTKQEELAGKVFVYGGNKTVVDIMSNCIFNDDEGDEFSPKATGIFYDENASYLFQLKYKLKGEYNNYEASNFIVTSKIGKMPIAGTPGEITEILNRRHDLFIRCDRPDLDELKKLHNKLMDGDDELDDGFTNEGIATPQVKPEPKTKPEPKLESEPKSESKPEPKVGKLGKSKEIAESTTEEAVEAQTEDVESMLDDLFKD